MDKYSPNLDNDHFISALRWLTWLIPMLLIFGAMLSDGQFLNAAIMFVPVGLFLAYPAWLIGTAAAIAISGLAWFFTE